MNKKLDDVMKVDFDIDVNIPKIILKAEEIKKKRKEKMQLIFFMASSVLILVAAFFAIFFGFGRVILYIEFFFFALYPFMLILAAFKAKHREA